MIKALHYRSVKRITAPCAAAFLLILTSSQALAQQYFHQRNLLPGTRAAQLGGAFTAIADDPSGGFYNPAGLVFAKASEVSLSANAYNANHIEYKAAINGSDFKEDSSAMFPSFVGANYRWSRLAGGYSFATLDARNINQDNRFDNISTKVNGPSQYTRTVQENNNHIIAGGALALGLGSHLSLGTTLYYYQRKIESTAHQYTKLNSDAKWMIDSKSKTDNEGMMPVVGLMWHGTNLSIGLCGRAPIAYKDRTTTTSDAMVYYPTTSDPNPAPVVSSLDSEDASQNEPNPRTLEVGFAYSSSPAFTIAFDTLYHEGVKTANTQLFDTFNYSLGVESAWRLATLRAGIFTNRSMNHRPEEGGRNQRAWINYVGYSTGIAVTSGNWEASLGAILQKGTGYTQILIDSTEIQDVVADSKVIFFGGRLNLNGGS